MSNKKNIIVIDDHPVVRSGIRAILSLDPALNVCCEAGSEAEAIAQLTALPEPVDLIVLDLSLSNESGLSLFRRLLNMRPNLRILIFSLHDEMVYAEKVIKAGTHGYLMKGESSNKLLEAIHHILNGNIYVSEAMHDILLKNMQHNSKANTPEELNSFTKNELIILELLAEGQTRNQIANHLNRSVKTIDAHCTNMKRKMNFSNNRMLVQFARQSKYAI